MMWTYEQTDTGFMKLNRQGNGKIYDFTKIIVCRSCSRSSTGRIILSAPATASVRDISIAAKKLESNRA